MDFRLLGAFEVSAKGISADLGPPKQRALLAVLLLHAGEIVPVDRLIDLLWGEQAPRTASHSIQIYVSELRKVFESIGGDRVLATRPPGYQLDANPESVDARRFERLVEQATHRLRTGDRDGAVDDLREALGLWRGPPLSDFAYEDFAQPYIRRFHDLHLDAVERLASAELDLGHATEMVPMLDAAVRDDPLRERSRELLMLALYRSGRHAEALRTYQQLRAVLNEELGLDPSPPLQRLQERILLHDPTLLPAPETPAAPLARNPYKGLRPFGEADAADFFGRDELVAQLLQALREEKRLVALVGPSGSGKSSVVAAGLIPRLRDGAVPGSERWVIAPMVPGVNPVAEVEAVIRAAAELPNGVSSLLDPERGGRATNTALRLMPEGGRLLLIIDQFEELFTITPDDARDRFLSAIATAVKEPDSNVSVVLGLRADYYDRPLLHPEFASVFTPGVVNALPMSAAELEAMVILPAERAGLSVERALLAQLVADAADRPGTLPLLEYALTELVDRRTTSALTIDDYKSLGGIRGVLSRSAESIYEALAAPDRQVAMQLFLRLVHLGRGTTESRRRMPLSDLTSADLDPVALSKVLEAFGRRRLLSFDREATTGQATVEIAHESLFNEWERLAGWIDRHRAALRRYEALDAAADEWDSSGRHADYLLTGTRLAEFEAWTSEGALPLGGREREFLAAGIERRDAEEAVERERGESARRLERRARMRLLALAAVVGLVVVGTIVAAWGGLFSDPPRVTLVHPGIGEVGALAEAGFDRAVRAFGLRGEEFIYEEGVGTEAAAIREASESGTELILVTFGLPGFEQVARDHPDVSYVVPFPLDGLPNVSYVLTAENEGSYLAGVAAAEKTVTGTIGFIGGYDDWFNWTWQAGFEAGARSADPDIEIITSYLQSGPDLPDAGAFGNPAGAEAEAARMFEAGADVILHAAGDSGLGVFEAAAELSTADRHLWGIGADSDQFVTVDRLSGAVHAEAWKEHILTSVVKRVDVVIYEVVAAFARGELEPGAVTFDLRSGAMDLSYSGGYIDEIRAEIEAARADIVSGRTVVPCFPADRVDLAREWQYPPDMCRG